MHQEIGSSPRACLYRSIAILALVAQVAVTLVGSSPVAAQTSPFFETLRTSLATRMQQLRVPGAVILIQDPQRGIWSATIGTSDLRSAAPIAPDMHFRIGSITKTFTGTVILQLVDEGKLKLDDPVAKYRPEVPNGANITIRQLLNMTSGLFNYTEDLAWNQALDANPQRNWTPQELVAIGFAHPPYFPPGTDFHYSNTNTVLLGRIIEQVTGNHVEDEFATRIFKPLGMNNTLMPRGGVATIPAPYPRGYLYGTNVESLDAKIFTGDEALRVNAAAGQPADWTDMSPSWAWTAGGAISTVADLGIYAKALASGTLVSAAAQRERLTYVPSAPGAPTYGLAIANFGGYIGHDGSLPGFQSFEGYNPTTGTTVVVLTNLQNAPDGHGTANELTMLIIGALRAPATPTAPMTPATSPSAQPFFIRRLGDG